MLKGIFYVFIAASVWGGGGVAGQYMFQLHGVDAIWAVMVRQIVAGGLFLLFTGLGLKKNIFEVLKDHPWKILSFSFLGILGAQLGYYYGISLCNAATVTVIQYTAPIYVLLWVAFANRRVPELREIVGMMLAMFGVFMISTHGSLDTLVISPKALIIAWLSAFSYAYYTVAPVELLKKYPATMIIGWGQLLSGLSLMALRNPFTPVGEWNFGTYVAFIYLVLGATVFTYAAYLQGLKIIGPTKASLVSCAEPVSSVVLMVLVIGTPLTWQDLLGMGCIIFTVTLLSLPKK